MKTKTFVIGLFLALCLAISLPAIHQVAQTQALQGGTMGPAPASGPSYYPVGSDCVGYWAFWDGTATDHSSYGNDGTVVGATFVENGLSFGGDDDKVVVAHDATLNLSSPFTIWVWCKFETAKGSGSYPMLVSKDYSLSYSLHFVAGTRVPRITSSSDYAGGTTVLNYDASYFVVFDHHLVGGINKASTYVNNVVDIDNLNFLPAATNANDLWIGANPASNYWFPGIIHEVLIFNSYQDATARTGYYNATKARYGVASLGPKYRNYQYAQEKKHEKSSLYRVPRNASVSSAMRGAKRGVAAHYRPPLFQDASRQGSARPN